MEPIYWITGFITFGLFVYLFIALLNPERFE